ncbi:MAG: lipoyl(octanoyl) transferase LipB [Alphaproteobacteria bacterium]
MQPEWKIDDVVQAYPAAVRTMDSRVADIRAGTARELIWLTEHMPLYTAGSSADPAELLEPGKFPVFSTGRGGKHTYHGPGQRLAYVLLDLKARKPDVRGFVHALEEWAILTLARFAVRGERREGRIGIWVNMGGGREAKIGAIGVRVRRWVTLHGMSLNIDPDLDHYAGIVPCGISDFGVTSLADLGQFPTMPEVDMALRETFAEAFQDFGFDPDIATSIKDTHTNVQNY